MKSYILIAIASVIIGFASGFPWGMVYQFSKLSVPFIGIK